MVWWYYTTAIYLNSMVIVYNWHLFCWPRDTIQLTLILLASWYYTSTTYFGGMAILYNCHCFRWHWNTIQLPLILLPWRYYRATTYFDGMMIRLLILFRFWCVLMFQCFCLVSPEFDSKFISWFRHLHSSYLIWIYIMLLAN